MNCRRSVTQLYGFSPISSLRGWFKIRSSTSMATISHTQWWFVPPKLASDHQGVVWIQFPCPRTPARERQGLSLSGRYARQLGPRLHIGYAQLTYTCAYTCTHTYIYMHTHIQIHRPYGYPPPADAPHYRCQLPAQTLKLRNRKISVKLRIFQQPGYQ